MNIQYPIHYTTTWDANYVLTRTTSKHAKTYLKNFEDYQIAGLTIMECKRLQNVGMLTQVDPWNINMTNR